MQAGFKCLSPMAIGIQYRKSVFLTGLHQPVPRRHRTHTTRVKDPHFANTRVLTHAFGIIVYWHCVPYEDICPSPKLDQSAFKGGVLRHAHYCAQLCAQMCCEKMVANLFFAIRTYSSSLTLKNSMKLQGQSPLGLVDS